MKIKWYGTASLMLESGNTRLLFDPYSKKHNRKLPRLDLTETRAADAIFITHPHFDHFGNISEYVGNGPVYVSAHGISLAQSHGFDVSHMLPIAAGDEVSVGNLTVRAYQSKHCKFDVPTVLRVAFSPRTYIQIGRAIKLLRENRSFRLDGDIYVYEVTDGEKTVVILGSAGLDEAENYPTGADLLVFPYQGRTKMHLYMHKFLEKFQPKAVMLDHFDNAFPPLTHTVNVKKFPTEAKKVLPFVSTIIPKENEWREI